MELRVLGPLQVRQYGLQVAVPGAKPRAILTMLGLHGGSVVSADTFLELLWGDDPPRTAAKALQTHISSLRRTLGDGFVLTEGTGWTLSTTEIDASRYKLAARMGRDAAAAGDTSQAVARFDEALTLWRGTPELPDGPRGTSEKTRWIEGHAALVEDRADALLATGRAAEIIGDLEAAIADAPLRERRWGQLMLALYRAGRQGEALGAYQRARSLLADQLGVDPSPDLRRLESAIVAQDTALEIPVSQQLSVVTRAVTFLLTDIEGSTAAWEADADAMAVALARHDELVEQVVTSRGGRLVKTRGEGDATFSVFDRPSAAAAAAIDLQEAILHEPWALLEPMRIRVALHTGEVELRDGDYFGRAVNRAARLRSLAAGGQILCSGATAELVIDSLPDDIALVDLGMRQLRNLARPEHVFELRLDDASDGESAAVVSDAPMERPELPAVLGGRGPFVGRGRELERLLAAWQTTLAGGMRAVLIAGEPGVGKTRLAGEWSRLAYEQNAVVLYGRCDEDLGAPYQPFAEALRSLVPCVGDGRLRKLRGVEALLPLVPGLTDALPDLAAPTRADPDTERYALFDAVVALLGVASKSAPVVLILDDLHWAAKPTLLLLRHLLRFGDNSRVQIIGTYRSTDLDRAHPLAAMLADLHRDGTADRLALGGLDEGDVTTYVAEAGYNDEELARALASVTGGNPFFLIEALRHVDESGGHWDPSTLPQGVREAVSRRLSRLPAETNKALAAAAVVGSRFAVDLVERVVGEDLIDAFDEASKAGIVIEEPGGRYRFNHAIVRQSLLAELASVRRMRLHQRIATTLEGEAGADDDLLAELAYHYFECAWAGNAAKAVDYCRRAADQAMARLAYEGAADLYDRALHALEELDEELPDRDDQQTELLVARCEALLAAGDVVSAAGAVSQLQEATRDSSRLAAWATCFDGQLSMLTDPERLDEIESAVGAAADKLAELDDAAGEAKAHTVRAGCLARLGRIGDCETALDHALTAARRARDHRRVNAVLAGAPLAALWGPSPVPRAGGRCLDVVRLLRITTGSPVVEAISTRCQALLDAYRGRAASGRGLIDSARRTLTELGMRHALLEVDQFAGLLELAADDPASAEPLLRRAYNGFRRMGLDADTAETAALLARAYLGLDSDEKADELCTESERLAGHALTASIAWRTVRAQLLSHRGDHSEARRIAEEAIAIAERTDALVAHGDACFALATVLRAAGDSAGAKAAAEQAVGLYELKGAAALAEKARSLLDGELSTAPMVAEPPQVELDNACLQAIGRLDGAIDREAWDEVAQLLADDVCIESRRSVVGHPRVNLSPQAWIREVQRARELGMVRHPYTVVAVGGQRIALTRMHVGTADVSPGAPQDEMLTLVGLDEGGLIALLLFFDVGDIDAAIAELDAAHARSGEQSRPPLENAASRADARFNALFADRRLDEIATQCASDVRLVDRRRGLREESTGRTAAVAQLRAIAEIGTTTMTSDVLAIRGERVALVRTRYSGRDHRPDAFHTELLRMVEVDSDERIVAYVAFDLDDFDAAFKELDGRYLAGEAAPHAHTWSVIMEGHSAVNRRELPPVTADCVNIDHRRGAAFAPGEMAAYLRAGWDLDQIVRTHIEVVHRLTDLGAVYTHAGHGVSHAGFDAEWRGVDLVTVDGDMVNRCEIFDEADLDVALARFDEPSRPAPRPENAANRVVERFLAHFPARDWDAMAEMLAEGLSTDDRRHVANAGIRQGVATELANLKFIAESGTTNITSSPIATRGERLVLARHGFSLGDWPESNQLVDVVEINADGQISAQVVFDPDDIDAAFEELDARYLAGEAAAHANTWSVVADVFAELARHEIPSKTPDRLIDHRRGTPLAHGDLAAIITTRWNITPDLTTHVETVHLLSDFEAVFTQVSYGRSQTGFDAEWRMINLVTVEGDRINSTEVFDEADLDAALARFDELSRPAPRLENAASRVYERFWKCFDDRDWDAMTEMFATGLSTDDRRRVVNAGVQRGRDVEIANMRSLAEIGANTTSTVMAIRGERLLLAHITSLNGDLRHGEFDAEMLVIIEIDADNRISAGIQFDPEDLDAAIAELDARYLVGAAAAHAHTWSVLTRGYASLNRHELPATSDDFVNDDHRHVATVAPGDGIADLRASWDLAPDVSFYIESVHRLNDLGAVYTHTANGTSQQGFEAEWRAIVIMTIKGDLINRGELFDEADVDAALARFDELSRPTLRLENTASRLAQRLLAHFAARDWDAMAESLATDYSSDDRRLVVGAGVRHGRDAAIENYRAMANLGFTNISSTVIATRGQRLAVTRAHATGGDPQPEAFRMELLCVAEIDTDQRIVAVVVFDVNEFDAAFAELDARYLAGEAATHSHLWSVVAGAYATLNRHELPPITPDFVSIDHRRGGSAFAPGDLLAYVRASWDDSPDNKIYVEAVHRLSNVGAVVTSATQGASVAGFNAEWREIGVVTVDGDMLNRTELFDEDDLDTALARFDELSRPAQRLENAASRAVERFQAHFAARDWHAMAEMVTADMCNDDRRRIVGAGLRRGRDVEIANVQALADVGVMNTTSVVIATRGERLALGRIRLSGRDQRPEAFHTEVLGLIEIDADSLIAARVWFELDDIDGAFEELEARYLAGEAATYAHTWAVIARARASLMRRELPQTTPDWVNLDHRRGIAFEPGDLTAYIRDSWDSEREVTNYIDAVYRLSNLGAVFTQVQRGTSQEGFEAEWRIVELMTVEGDLINRAEFFDEADVDAALARFDELSRPTPRLENAASQVDERFRADFAARDWHAMAERLADATSTDDRRPLLGVGVRRNRDAVVADWRATAEVGVRNVTSTVIAIRGDRLVLSRYRFSGRDQRPEAFRTDVLGVVEIDADQRIAACVMLDLDDIDAAFEELDARYLAGEAAAHAQTWSATKAVYAAFNRRELPPTTPDWVNIDHRRGTAFAPGDVIPYIRSAWDVAPDINIYIQAVHRLSNLGAVVTFAAHGTSGHGFDAEWREITALTFEGDALNRCELFDEENLDAAVARFDELSRLTPQLENGATRTWRQIVDACNRRDADGFLALSSADGQLEDRRKGLRAYHEGSERRRAAEAMCRAPESWHLEVEPIAIRGYRLGLTRERWRDTDEADRPITVESLTLTEVTGDELAHHTEVFDPDDTDAAFEALDARYLAGEAAAHAHTWSFIAGVYAALNRREFPATTPGWVNIDHRRGRAFASGDTDAYIRAAWDLTPDICYRIEAVHRLNNLGAVVTHVSKGTSQEGFDAEWRVFNLVTFEDNQINRCELFDEHDLDAALARFEELTRPA